MRVHCTEFFKIQINNWFNFQAVLTHTHTHRERPTNLIGLAKASIPLSNCIVILIWDPPDFSSVWITYNSIVKRNKMSHISTDQNTTCLRFTHRHWWFYVSPFHELGHQLFRNPSNTIHFVWFGNWICPKWWSFHWKSNRFAYFSIIIWGLNFN